jgi:glycosyltransferase involved in cell wall biosynthesis
MKSIVYVTTSFPTLAWFLENEVAKLTQRGFRVRVFTLRSVGTQYQPDHESLVRITRAMGSPFAPAAWWALLQWLVRKPHVLIGEFTRILWSSRSSAYALVGHIGYLPATALIASAVEREDIDQVHGAWAHFPATVAYLAARLTGRPFSMAGHAGGDIHRTQAFLAEKVRAAQFVTACVRENAETLQRLGGPGARVEWIYHGVDLRRFDGEGRRRGEEPTLITVGRLASTKGFDVAIRALAVLRERGLRPTLIMVGDGPLRATLESLVQSLELTDQVRMIGALSHEQLLPLYRSAWLLVAPSVELSNGRRDGIPNVVVEAMAMRLPCVGSRAAGLEEVIAEGETGWLSQPGDPMSLADALQRALADPARLDEVGERSRSRVLREFDTDRNIERLVALFSELPAARERTPAVAGMG